jgi:hypothetical protein
MRGNRILTGLLFAVILMIGQAYAGDLDFTVRANQGGSDDISTITAGQEFTIDIAIANNTNVDFTGGSFAIRFRSPNSLIRYITYVPITDGEGPQENIEWLNNFAGCSFGGDCYMDLGVIIEDFGADGEIPDTISFGPLGTNGVPAQTAAEYYIRMHLQIDSGVATTGQFCIDSSETSDPDYDWLIEPADFPMPTFEDRCWDVIDVVLMDVQEITDPQELLPTEFSLSENYPNPFNPSTQFEFTVPAKSHVSIEIYNVLGQKIKDLVNEELAAGRYQVDWNGTTNSGTQAASGIYFYRMTTKNFEATKKMLLLK